MRPFDEILAARFEVPAGGDWMAKYREPNPEPRFDVIAAADITALLPYVSAVERPAEAGQLFGIPVVVDEAVDPGWLELRKGEDVIERIPL